MKLLFRLWARGLAITLAAIFLSGCSTFSTFFQNETVSIAVSYTHLTLPTTPYV